MKQGLKVQRKCLDSVAALFEELNLASYKNVTRYIYQSFKKCIQILLNYIQYSFKQYADDKCMKERNKFEVKTLTELGIFSEIFWSFDDF